MVPAPRGGAEPLETMMRRNAWLVSATIVVALSASVRADAPLDPAVEARIKALEERVAQLENRLTAVTNAQKAAALARDALRHRPLRPMHMVHVTPQVPSSAASVALEGSRRPGRCSRSA